MTRRFGAFFLLWWISVYEHRMDKTGWTDTPLFVNINKRSSYKSHPSMIIHGETNTTRVALDS